MSVLPWLADATDKHLRMILDTAAFGIVGSDEEMSWTAEADASIRRLAEELSEDENAIRYFIAANRCLLTFFSPDEMLVNLKIDRREAQYKQNNPPLRRMWRVGQKDE